MRNHWRRYLSLICVLGTGWLSSCDTQKQPANLSYEDALAKVRQKIPAESYFSNEFLKKAAAERPNVPATPDKVRIGMPWILNDECALWFVAVEKGYFRDMGIDTAAFSRAGRTQELDRPSFQGFGLQPSPF